MNLPVIVRDQPGPGGTCSGKGQCAEESTVCSASPIVVLAMPAASRLEDVHDVLAGNTGSGGVGRGYRSDFGLNALAEELARIEVHELVRGLRWVASRRLSALE